jgi:hypothetical protein
VTLSIDQLSPGLHEQAAVVEAFRDRIVGRSGVEAAFVGGSIGAGRADSLSDVDLVTIYSSPQTRNAAWKVRREIFALLGRVLFVADADHVGPHLQVGALAGPVMVDLSYRILSDLTPGWWYNQVVLLRDDHGRFAHLQEDSRRLQPDELSEEWLTNLTRKFWRWALYVARDIVRDEPLQVLEDLDFIRRNGLLPLAALAAGAPTHRLYRFDRVPDTEAVQLTRVGHLRSLDRSGMEAALWQTVDSFLALRARAQGARPHPIDVDDEVGRGAVSDMLGKKLV